MPKRSARPARKKKRARGARPEPRDDGPLQMRVVGGMLRTRRIKYSGDLRVRPMKDRTREAVFNLVGPDVRDTHVWDLFAGTGAMAIEALSRGARSATLIEHHMGAARVIAENLAELSLEDRTHVVRSDVFHWAKAFATGQPPALPTPVLPPLTRPTRAKSTRAQSTASPNSTPMATEAPWLVFCCPPYIFYRERLDDLIRLLTDIRDAAPAYSTFVVEAEVPFDFECIWPSGWRTREYAPAAIGIW